MNISCISFDNYGYAYSSGSNDQNNEKNSTHKKDTSKMGTYVFDAMLHEKIEQLKNIR